MATLAQALASLRPGAEWRLEGDNLADIEWLTEGVKAPTVKQIETELDRLGKAQEAEDAAKAAARSAALDKLKALGLTLDDLSALGIVG